MFRLTCRRLIGRLTCRLLELRVRWRFHRGLPDADPQATLALLDRLLRTDAGSFVGHLHLGLVHAEACRRLLALREFGIAQRLAPARFLRARIPDDLKAAVLSRIHRPRESLFELPAPGPAGRSADGEKANRSRAPESTGKDRFAGRPPITREEIASADLDALLERLTQES